MAAKRRQFGYCEVIPSFAFACLVSRYTLATEEKKKILKKSEPQNATHVSIARGREAGRGEVLPYISLIGMCRHIGYWVGFLCRFGLKTGSLHSKRFQSSHCAEVRAGAKKRGETLATQARKGVYTLPILVWNRLWFSRELRGVWTHLSFQFQMSKKEREICEFKMDLNNFFVCALIWVVIT